MAGGGGGVIFAINIHFARQRTCDLGGFIMLFLRESSLNVSTYIISAMMVILLTAFSNRVICMAATKVIPRAL